MGDQPSAVAEQVDYTRLPQLLRAQESVNVGEQYVAGDYAAPRRREWRLHGVPGQVGNLEQVRLGNRTGAGPTIDASIHLCEGITCGQQFWASGRR
jgi:hypothetical protein